MNPETTMEIVTLSIALALVFVNGFFVATEFAIVKARPTRIEELVREGRAGSLAARHLVQHLDSYLSACQLGITLASLGLGWLGEPAFAALIGPALIWIGVDDPISIHSIALVLAFLTITFLHIVVGEMAPKAIAILRAESVAVAVAYPMRLFYIVFFPIIWVLNSVANALVRAVGISGMSEHQHHSVEEIKMILTQARTTGLLSPTRSELVEKAIRLSGKTAEHLMVPRSEVVVLDINHSLKENMQRAMKSGRTRFPLVERELDEVIGIVDIRHVLHRFFEGEEINLKSVVETPTYVPEMMSGERLLSEFRNRHIPMAIVVDEYGGASGIVTSSDVVTAVMGEIDEEDNEIVRLPGGAWDLDGTAHIEEVAEKLKITIDTSDIHTIAGFFMEKLGRVPKKGDLISCQSYIFRVIEMDGPRVEKVRVQRESSDPS